MGLFATNGGWSAFVLRLVLGVVMFVHGAQKVLGWFGGTTFVVTLNMFVQKMHMPLPLALLVMAAEFLGGLGLIVGLLTRLAAFGILCDMAGAIALVHWRFGLFMNWSGKNPGEGFEYHLLVIAICIALIARGGGALSLDHALAGEPE
jgi:putative oxidoreductase